MNKQIKEVETQLRQSLNEWADILLAISVKGDNHEFRFNEDDMMNMLIMFQEITHNLAFYKNSVNDTKASLERAEKFGKGLRTLIKEFTNFDSGKHFNK